MKNYYEDIGVFITDFDFELSKNTYGPSYVIFSPGDIKVNIINYFNSEILAIIFSNSRTSLT